jgi:hypothetical protein
MTDKYVYFQQFGDESTTYRTPSYGSINVTEFTAALEAAIEN